MKNDRLAIMLLACAAATAASASAFAQGALPNCETANYDSARNLYTVMNPARGTVFQQCVLTIQVEGYYDVVLSGGGGGGGGGDSAGGGGGGAGAAPFKTVKFLSPGRYTLTLGAGGEGGMPGKPTQGGGSTSLTKADTGEHIAGFVGADRLGPNYQVVGNGRGGVAEWGGSNGGDGGKVLPTMVASAQSGGTLRDAGYSGTAGQAGREIDRSVRTAQPGGMLQISGYAGSPGSSGGEPIRTARANDGRVVDAFAGGGGGAGFGDGGIGQPADGSMAAGSGDLGGGAGGGRGGEPTYTSITPSGYDEMGPAGGTMGIADHGGRGGDGFIQLTLQMIAAAPATQVVPQSQAVVTTPEPAVTREATTPAPPASRPARRDRN